MFFSWENLCSFFHSLSLFISTVVFPSRSHLNKPLSEREENECSMFIAGKHKIFPARELKIERNERAIVISRHTIRFEFDGIFQNGG
jgi:hypothetical protein